MDLTGAAYNKLGIKMKYYWHLKKCLIKSNFLVLQQTTDNGFPTSYIINVIDYCNYSFRSCKRFGKQQEAQYIEGYFHIKISAQRQ